MDSHTQKHTQELQACTRTLCRNKDAHKLLKIECTTLPVRVVHSATTAAVKSLEAAPSSQTAHEEVSQAAGTFTTCSRYTFLQTRQAVKPATELADFYYRRENFSIFQPKCSLNNMLCEFD